MNKINAKCNSCRGTGLYRGYSESAGIAVVCFKCEGSGCRVIEYEPFVQRERRNDVQHVQRSAGMFIATGTGPTGRRISYAEFLSGVMP